MAFETPIIEVIFATITENLSAVTNDTQGYHTTQVLEYFTADGEPSWSLLPSLVSLLSGSIMHPESTYFCIPKVACQVQESQKRISINTNHIYHQHSSS